LLSEIGSQLADVGLVANQILCGGKMCGLLENTGVVIKWQGFSISIFNAPLQSGKQF
jgi:hypothetical protein